MTDVDDYISGVDSRVRGQFEAVRSIVKKALPKASESVKWRVPFYTVDGVPVASIADYTDHVNLYLTSGAKLSSSLLEGTGRGMRHITVRTVEDIREKEFIRLLKAAAKLAQSAPKRTTKRKTPRHPKRPARV